jgi:hypothetical protein
VRNLVREFGERRQVLSVAAGVLEDDAVDGRVIERIIFRGRRTCWMSASITSFLVAAKLTLRRTAITLRLLAIAVDRDRRVARPIVVRNALTAKYLGQALARLLVALGRLGLAPCPKA